MNLTRLKYRLGPLIRIDEDPIAEFNVSLLRG